MMAALLLTAGMPGAQADEFASGQVAEYSDRKVFSQPVSSIADTKYIALYSLNGQTLDWSVYGLDGTFAGSGQIGPFGRVCAVAGSSKRFVVADSNPTSQKTTLYLYRQIESATPATKLLGTYVLASIPPSGTALCRLAMAGDFAYFGTDQSLTYYQINLGTGELRTGGDQNTRSITANNAGVVVSQGDLFVAYDLQGNVVREGPEHVETFVPGQNAYTP
jgi:hypothetical protein